MGIDAIRFKCRDGKIRWSAHAAARLLQRGITREDVLNCIATGEIIEEYPDYWLNPSCLICGVDSQGGALHAVAGLDESVHVVTAYRPDTGTFMPDLKTRREG